MSADSMRHECNGGAGARTVIKFVMPPHVLVVNSATTTTSHHLLMVARRTLYTHTRVANRRLRVVFIDVAAQLACGSSCAQSCNTWPCTSQQRCQGVGDESVGEFQDVHSHKLVNKFDGSIQHAVPRQ